MKIIKIFFKEILKSIISLFISIYFIFLRKQDFDVDKIDNILFICLKPLGIGDLLMDTPCFREIKSRLPNKNIVLLTDKDLLNRSKLFDEIIIKNSFKDLIKLRKKYDLIVLLNKNLLQSLAALFLRKRYLLGYLYNWRVKANFRLKYSFEFSPKIHYYNMGSNVIKSLGIDNINWKLEKLNWNSNELNSVKKAINYDNEKIIVINPNVLWKSRTWPKEKYKELIKRLIADKKFKIVIIGGLEDIEYNQEFDKHFSDENNYINITGKINLFELAALFSISDLLITGDAGPMHIAVSEGCKILSLWGVTDPLTRLPLDRIDKDIFYIYPGNDSDAGKYNMEHEPINNKVIDGITVDEVYSKLMEIIK